MTLKITIVHASPGYPAIAHIAAGNYGAVEAKDGQPPADRWIHSGASAVVHELQPGETIEQAEARALNRMWGAYRNSCGGKSVGGAELPVMFSDMPAEVQKHWLAALRAI